MFSDLTLSEWKEPDADPGNTLTLLSVQRYAQIYLSTPTKTDTEGIIMSSQLNVESVQYIASLLHLLIGLVNKPWLSMLLFFDEFVGKVSDEEATLKDNIGRY